MANTNPGANILLTHENADDFFGQKENPTKAVLFTKKMETPALWLRVADSFAGKMQFGEVRLAEFDLMQQFGMSTDALPKVVAIRVNYDGSKQKILYEGPNDFDKIREFLGDVMEGGPAVVELKRQLDSLQREAKGLKQEIAHEQERTSTARAEAARIKLGQVGQVETVRKELQAEIEKTKAAETAVREELEAEKRAWEEKQQQLKEEKAKLEVEVQALKDVQQEKAILLNDTTEENFFASTLRPLRAVLFTTKADIPQLWLDLAAQQSISCSFGVVRHTEEKLMTRFGCRTDSLPRILLFSNKTDTPIVYQGSIKLDTISAFIQDAIAGGPAALELRKQLRTKETEAEKAEKELRDERQRRERESEEAQRTRKQQVGQLEETVKSLQKQLREACAGAGAELQRVRQESEEKYK
eukprot:CAMPEP_0181343420 /NCGR_PEP_ID=MMETSP1101-20121128/31579_1 /TAXON_ID=46948 /ORGANISM="Rhodomonas abbreviata, Strain Caron Lab Isolate" /LENGTH=413 /DNA_ID=CAMNT_0023455053 /DNA_START=200 /DNA_END=1438 /DNA_ORIENTATION=+